jgi:hypothetical protein
MNHEFENRDIYHGVCPWDLIIIDGDERTRHFMHYNETRHYYYILLDAKNSKHLEYLISNDIFTIDTLAKSVMVFELILNQNRFLELL